MSEIPTIPPLPDLLDPESVFERRRIILEALKFEHDLEDKRFVELEALAEKLEEEVDKIREFATAHELTRNSLDDAISALRDAFSNEEIAELKAQGHL